jgi:hypothetical protein
MYRQFNIKYPEFWTTQYTPVLIWFSLNIVMISLNSIQMLVFLMEFDVIHPVVYINKVKWCIYSTVQHNYLLK